MVLRGKRNHRRLTKSEFHRLESKQDVRDEPMKSGQSTGVGIKPGDQQ